MVRADPPAPEHRRPGLSRHRRGDRGAVCNPQPLLRSNTPGRGSTKRVRSSSTSSTWARALGERPTTRCATTAPRWGRTPTTARRPLSSRR
ncbi:MAG: hypothetical protein MZV64_44220 [Ignavibacteriales bacterium]|nr:hypothetical protein [Ignavibacteriales bacterium]